MLGEFNKFQQWSEMPDHGSSFSKREGISDTLQTKSFLRLVAPLLLRLLEEGIKGILCVIADKDNFRVIQRLYLLQESIPMMETSFFRRVRVIFSISLLNHYLLTHGTQKTLRACSLLFVQIVQYNFSLIGLL